MPCDTQTVSDGCRDPLNAAGEALPWYAVRVRSNFEHVAAAGLRGKGYEEYLPYYRCRRRWSDRVKEVDVPLFPGYVFCRIDIERRLSVLVTPGVISIMGFGKLPEPVDENEVDAVRAIIASGLPAQPWPFLKVGQPVTLQRGPLTGLDGIVVAVKNKLRLVVSVTLLQRSVSVEIDRDWIRPVNKSYNYRA